MPPLDVAVALRRILSAHTANFQRTGRSVESQGLQGWERTCETTESPSTARSVTKPCSQVPHVRLLNTFSGGDPNTALNSLSQHLTPSLKKFFQISKLKPPLEHLDAISLCPFRELERAVSFPEHPFLRVEHPQLPRLLFTGFTLPTLPQLRRPSLASLQPLNVLPQSEGPEWNTGFEAQARLFQVQGMIMALVLLATNTPEEQSFPTGSRHVQHKHPSMG